MKKMGAKKHPFYRIVAADARSPRDGRFIEILGFYDPMTDPANIRIDEDKLYKWLDNGAIPTDNTASILRSEGLLEKWQLLRSGVKISEVDAVIEARREKQPKAEEKKGRKISKKAAAAAEKEKAEQLKAKEEAKAEEDKIDDAETDLNAAVEEEGSENPKTEAGKDVPGDSEESSPEAAEEGGSEETPKE